MPDNGNLKVFADISRHAMIRLSQRAIRASIVDLVFSYSDREVPRGDGIYALSISRSAMAEMINEGVHVDLAARAEKAILLLDAEGSTMITALRPQGRRGRRYQSCHSGRGRRHRGAGRRPANARDGR